MQMQHCDTVCRFLTKCGREFAVYSNVSLHANEGYILDGVFKGKTNCGLDVVHEVL